MSVPETPSLGPDIELSHLEAAYGDRLVLQDVNAVLPGGGITVLLGESGCGKSTLLKCLLGLLPICGGTISMGGRDLALLPENELTCLRRDIGVLFQSGALLGSLNLADNVALPLREHTSLSEKDIQAQVHYKLSLVGLEEFGTYMPSELSGGMKKRGGLARALALDPRILLVDEPTSGLDPITAASLDRLLLELNHLFKKTIVVVTHDMESVSLIADHVVMLFQGKVLYEGDKLGLAKSPSDEVKRFLHRVPAMRAQDMASVIARMSMVGISACRGPQNE